MPLPNYDIAPQEDVDKIKKSITARLLDLTDFFDNGDFNETVTVDDLKFFTALSEKLEDATDELNCTGNIGKD